MGKRKCTNKSRAFSSPATAALARPDRLALSDKKHLKINPSSQLKYAFLNKNHLRVSSPSRRHCHRGEPLLGGWGERQGGEGVLELVVEDHVQLRGAV